MKFTLTKVATAVALVGLAIAGGLAFNKTDQAHGPVTFASRAPSPFSMGSETTTAPPTSPSLPSISTAVMTAPQRGTKIKELIESGKPEAAFTAGLMLFECKRARAEEVARAQATPPTIKNDWYGSRPKVSEACPGLEGYESQYAQLMIAAGKAGVQGVFDIVNATDDPELGAHYQEIQLAAIAKGDPSAMVKRSDDIISKCGKKCTDEQLLESAKLRQAAWLRGQAEGRTAGFEDPMPGWVAILDKRKPGLGALAVEQGKALAESTSRRTN